MKRMQAVGMGAAALLAGWMVTGAAQAGDERQAEVRRPDRRVEIARVFGGGGRLGVSIEDVRAGDVARLGLSAERGAVVTSVEEGSAADKAGVKQGDVIVRFGGQDVWSAAQLARAVRETPAGRTVDLGVSRGGSVQTLSVTLAKPDRDPLMGPGPMGGNFHFEIPDMPDMPDMPEPPEIAGVPAPPRPPMPFAFGPGRGRKLGLAYQELGEQLARYFKVEGGVLVTDVSADGPAGKAGVRAGDVIVRIGGTRVKDGEDLRDAIREAEEGSTVTIGVQRDGKAMDLSVRIGAAETGRLAPPARGMRRRGAGV